MARWQRILLYALALLVLLGVFALYLQPDFMVALDNFIWSCFGVAPAQ